ncbi:SPOR domain-containing protein, partial [Succinivibrio sp.]
GVFSKKANVDALVSVLNSKGFKTISQNININGKAMIRVFAGTSKTREGALAICNKVKKNTKEQCRIVAL